MTDSSTTVRNYRDLFDLSGRNALVIGAGSGIGKATAQGLADFGANVTCADMDLEAASSVAAELTGRGATATAAQANIGNENDVQRLIEGFDRLDVLVCTPSINVRKPLAKVTAEEFDRVVGVNLRGSFFVMRAAGTKMAA
ncbi:MAG TPA: SDR family NAD(P)-dependent oxidoreductase, partial [Trueperaceae bacterium]|nr:SDR family NAD(P)-dependent oxidoreductase [Trueperaceae bacterium]